MVDFTLFSLYASHSLVWIFKKHPTLHTRIFVQHISVTQKCINALTQRQNNFLCFQWDEVSVLDDRGKLIRTFEVCNVNQNPRLQDNWLATPFLFRDSAPRVFVTLRFSVRDCASLRSPSPTCRETLTLYYKQADSQRELERTWAAEVGTAEQLK